MDWPQWRKCRERLCLCLLWSTWSPAVAILVGVYKRRGASQVLHFSPWVRTESSWNPSRFRCNLRGRNYWLWLTISVDNLGMFEIPQKENIQGNSWKSEVILMRGPWNFSIRQESTISDFREMKPFREKLKGESMKGYIQWIWHSISRLSRHLQW